MRRGLNEKESGHGGDEREIQRHGQQVYVDAEKVKESNKAL